MIGALAVAKLGFGFVLLSFEDLVLVLEDGTPLVEVATLVHGVVALLLAGELLDLVFLLV